ncbi:MAG TPA: VOC family protein [Longimicrobiales bacterium]|nr:VOC family protein [Longimicrobiales bacterium]
MYGWRIARRVGPRQGEIAWVDLTVDDAPAIRDFYGGVVGWTPSPVTMGDYDDFNMHAPGAGPVAGVCHARAGNADLPAQWLIYVVVADLDRSLAECERLGGRVLGETRRAGGGLYAVIADPAGAVCALFQPSSG